MGSGTDIDDDETLDADLDDELDDDELDSDDEYDKTIVIDTNDDDTIDKFEAADSDDLERKRAIKRRLEQLAEERDIDLDSTYNFNFSDDEL